MGVCPLTSSSPHTFKLRLLFIVMTVYDQRTRTMREKLRHQKVLRGVRDGKS